MVGCSSSSISRSYAARSSRSKRSPTPRASASCAFRSWTTDEPTRRPPLGSSLTSSPGLIRSYATRLWPGYRPDAAQNSACRQRNILRDAKQMLQEERTRNTMDHASAERMVRLYVEGWKEGNRAKILGNLDPACV